jgi:magnesium transporter
MSEKRFFHVGSDGTLTKIPTLDELLGALRQGGYAWLDFFDPHEEDLTPLVEPLGLHPLSVEDCLDQDQVPKIEDFPTNTFMLLNGYRYQDGELALEEVDFILGRNFLVTVSGHQGGSLKVFERVEEIARQDPAGLLRGPDYLLHVVLDYVVDHKFGAIETIQDAIDTAEEQILQGPSAFSPETLMRLRRDLLTLRKSLFHEREILVKICRRDSPYVSENAIYHFRDIYDHLARYFEIVEVYREMITSLLEIYLSMINNRMAQVANRTNATVRRLTLITTVFMPLTLLAGIGGMSEWSMMTGPSNWKIAYPAFLLGMVVIGTVNYWMLKRAEARKPAAAVRPPVAPVRRTADGRRSSLGARARASGEDC